MSARVEVVARATVGQPAWDAFVQASDEAWFWHLWDLQDALTTWRHSHNDGFAVIAGDEVLAVMPVQRVESRRAILSGCDLRSLGGPALGTGVQGKLRTRTMEAVRGRLDDLAAKHRAREVAVSLSSVAPAFREPNVPRVSPLLSLGGENATSQTWILALGREEEALWERMQGRARTAVRKARREGAEVRAAGPGDLDRYYDLHRATYGRTGEAPHPRAYFERIWERFLPGETAFALIAERDGEAIAAQTFAVMKGAAAYWTGAASESALSIGANNLIQWEALRKLLERGVLWYEAGEAFPASRDSKLRGLSEFKRSTGGELYPLFRTRIEPSSRLARMGTHGRGLVRALASRE